MRSWDLNAIGVNPHEPKILASAEDARTVILLPVRGRAVTGSNPASPILESPAYTPEARPSILVSRRTMAP